MGGKYKYFHINYKFKEDEKVYHGAGLAKAKCVGELLISCTNKDYWVSRITEITKEEFKNLRKPMKEAEKRDPRRKKNKKK